MLIAAHTQSAQAPSADAPYDETLLLEEVGLVIERNPALRMAIMDVQAYDETLVLLTNSLVSGPFIKLSLEAHWPGPIEVYDAASLFSSQNQEV